MSREGERRGPGGMEPWLKVLLIVGGAVLGLVMGGCCGFGAQFMISEQQGSINDAYALGVICGVSCIGLVVGALAGLLIMLLFGGSSASRRPPPPNPWGEDEEEERPRRR